MGTKESIHGYLVAEQKAQDEVEDIQYKISHLKDELRKLESKLIGAKLARDRASDCVQWHMSKKLVEVVTERDVEIAAMKGIHIVIGESMTNDLRSQIKNTPPLPKFRKDDNGL